MFNLTIPNYYDVQDHLGYCVWCGKELLSIVDMKQNVVRGVKIVLNKETGEMVLCGDYGSFVYDRNIGYVNNRDFYETIKKYQNKFKTNAYICDECCDKYRKNFITDRDPLNFNNISRHIKKLEKGYYCQVPRKGFAYFFNNKEDRNRLLTIIDSHPFLKLDELTHDHISFRYDSVVIKETITVKQNEVLISYNHLWINSAHYKVNGEVGYDISYEVIPEREFMKRFAYREF